LMPRITIKSPRRLSTSPAAHTRSSTSIMVMTGWSCFGATPATLATGATAATACGLFDSRNTCNASCFRLGPAGCCTVATPGKATVQHLRLRSVCISVTPGFGRHSQWLGALLWSLGIAAFVLQSLQPSRHGRVVHSDLLADIPSGHAEFGHLQDPVVGGVRNLAGRPGLGAVRLRFQLRLERLNVLAVKCTGLFEVDFEAGTLIRRVVAWAAQRDDGIQQILALAGASLLAALAGVVNEDHRAPCCALTQRPFRHRLPALAFVLLTTPYQAGKVVDDDHLRIADHLCDCCLTFGRVEVRDDPILLDIRCHETQVTRRGLVRATGHDFRNAIPEVSARHLAVQIEHPDG